MHTLKIAYLAIISALIVAACGSSPQVADQHVVEEPEAEPEPQFNVDTSGWSQERLVVEERFRTWMAGESLDDALEQGIPRFTEVVEEKAEGQQQLEQDFRRFVEGAGDPEVLGWVTVRVSQTYLNFGCELDAMSAPQGLTPDQREAYLKAIQDRVTPLLSQATNHLTQIEGREIPLWSDKAAHILDGIDPRTDDSCAATAEFWLPEDRPTPEERLASAAEGCANDELSACRDALRFASEEEAPEFLVRSCELSPDHCREAAMHFIENDEPLKADELLNIGCSGDRNQFDSCRLKAAYAHPELAEQYHARCVDGDYLGCVNFLRATEATNQSDVHDICAAPEADDFDERETVETACADGDANSCLALGAYLFHNQPEPEPSADDVAMSGDSGDLVIGRGTGGMGLRGSGAESDSEAELEEYEIDCADGDADACMSAGQLLEQLDRDPGSNYSDACELGDGAGCYRISQSVDSGEEADRFLERGCEYEYGPACRTRAEQLQQTQEAGEHHREIVDLLRTTCTGDDPSTCEPLARYFKDRGDGLTDQTCALYYDSVGCDVDHSFRCNPLLF